MGKEILVFGSNMHGSHGAGSALCALERYGAILGRAIGRQGDSYAIPTLTAFFNQLPIDIIKGHVNNFIEYAKDHADDTFKIVAIGCGIAGFKAWEIAPMFRSAPSNCILPDEFKQALYEEGLESSEELKMLWMELPILCGIITACIYGFPLFCVALGFK